MAKTITKLITIQSFRARGIFGGPSDAVGYGHTAPIFRRLSS